MSGDSYEHSRRLQTQLCATRCFAVDEFRLFRAASTGLIGTEHLVGDAQHGREAHFLNHTGFLNKLDGLLPTEDMLAVCLCVCVPDVTQP